MNIMQKHRIIDGDLTRIGELARMLISDDRVFDLLEKVQEELEDMLLVTEGE